jgi:septal ring factor EnvC (AmiA/AmiB activator)
MISFLRHILLCVAVVLMAAGPVAAQNTKAQENRKAALEKEIAEIDRQLKATSSKTTSALSTLSLVRKKISNRKALVAESDQAIAALEAEIRVRKAEVARIQGRLDTLSFYYGRLVRNAYKNRDSRIWYMYILSSRDLGQAWRRYSYLRDLSASMNVQARKIKETRAELEEEMAQLEQKQAEAREARTLRQQEVNKLQKEESESQALVNKLNKDKKRYQNELAAKRRQVEALNREIERIIRAAMESKGTRKGGKKPGAPIADKLGNECSSNKGRLPWPAEGPVIDHYGQHYHPVFKNVKLPFNNGMTIGLSKGTAVKAVFNGTVKQIVVMPGYNQCVLVQHGNYFSFYCKLGSVSVKPGEKVKTGQVLGTVDTIAGETALHFQIWEGRSPQNPELWLRP